ncbi:hypothetical protein FXF61_07605 [Pseudomonas sp. C27(2019)]|uniref:flagellar hook-length control protein FliK n=1 Tax=Pseudomonas sp. C27(2019) TaxID=2604941 RepID=UPI001247FD90|nr:flagellar hook-length control protein FliK [Pseudomonas sp. C27(2019)]QEY59047.1 hypothetical protein FXF61_07605 [Pseudomonas sp. C27(2019)]
MATTDFLLRPAAQAPRAAVTAPSHAAPQRGSAPAAPQSFSAVYEQQRIVKANQQQAQQAQQRSDALQQEKQQQAARHSAAKSAAAPVKDKAQTADKKPTVAKDSRTESDDTSNAPVNADASSSEARVEQGGNQLPQDTLEPILDVGEDVLDPLLLMAMIAPPAEQTAETVLKSAGSEAQLLTRQVTISLESTEEPLDSEALLTEDEALVLEKNSSKTDTSGLSEKAAILTSTSGKAAEVLVEKGAADKANNTALLETVKAAPDTLLNSKAVTPTDSIRADMQPRQDPLLAAQQTRQVPGAAIAMQQPGWTQQVTDKVMWMSSQNLKSAEIKLDPAELGRLDIKIDMSQEHTQVTFTSANAGVRESLETQMHRLRELLAQQGMQDVDVNVADQSQQQADAQAQELAQGRTGAGAGTDNGEEVQQQVTPLHEQQDGRLGLVDYYA